MFITNVINYYLDKLRTAIPYTPYFLNLRLNSQKKNKISYIPEKHPYDFQYIPPTQLNDNLEKINVLVINSGTFGGSFSFLKQWIKENSSKYNIFILEYEINTEFRLYNNGLAKERISIISLSVFNELIKSLGISLIFVNELTKTYVIKMITIIKASNIPYEYFIHDYLCINPYHFDILQDEQAEPLIKWKEEWHSFLSCAFKLYTPSNAAKEIVLKHYPDLKILVKKHKPLYKFFNIYSKENSNKAILTVGILGAIGRHKGKEAILALARKIKQKRLAVKLKVIGYLYIPPEEGLDDIIEITGYYSYEQLPSLIKQSEIAFFLFPSIWHETYSYVCDEIIQLGYPILIFGLGAQKERINDGLFGWISPLELKTSGLLNKIIELGRNRGLIAEKADQIKKHQKERIDIIIPVFNSLSYLSSCINSVIKNTDLESNILIIDDASTDPAIPEYINSIQNSNPLINITSWRNKTNLGFVKTVNKALSKSDNHCVILNSDTIVPKGWLSRLIQPLKTNYKTASVTPYSNAATICSFPYIKEYNNLPEGYSVEMLDSIFCDLNKDKTLQIPTGVGFCMAMNRNTINDIGYFDEEAFGMGYGEENDWCIRATQKGYKHIHVQDLFVYHLSRTKSIDLANN